MDVLEKPVTLPHDALPEADWGDAFATCVNKPFDNARAAGEAAFATFPLWVYWLMALRNVIVAPFGLKTGRNRDTGEDRVGFFPLIAEHPDQVVMGMDDRHLDFRCIVDLGAAETGQEVVITTVLKRHNLLGRIYLSVITPFHKAILRMTMKRLSMNGVVR